MKRLLQSFKNLLTRDLGGPRLRWQRPSFGRVAGILSLLGLVVLTYVLGAGAMFFDGPSSSFLSKAFAGAQVWLRHDQEQVPSAEWSQGVVSDDSSGQAFDGYTLVTKTNEPGATLLDMNGKTVHQWKMTFRRNWPPAAGVSEPEASDNIHWERCHLYPNGDILAVCCANPGSPYGYGLAKFDKNSQLIWGVSANVHHNLEVGEDGRIYVLVHRSHVKLPPGFSPNPFGYIADDVLVLTSEGRELDRIPILDAFLNSPFALDISESGSEGSMPMHPPTPQGPGGPPTPQAPGGPPLPPGGFPPLPGQGPPGPPGADPMSHTDPGDLLHTNSVRCLSESLAAKFPLFKAGQLLLSLRSPSLLAVLDTKSRSIVWAVRGPWKLQHDAQFLDNGRLLLFDNLGTYRGSRILEYDPVTQAIPWSYGGDEAALFKTLYRGSVQRLANGNTLIVDPDGLQVLEVTGKKEIVWKWGAPNPQKDAPSSPDLPAFTMAQRYAPEELTFLKGRNNHVPPR